MERISVGEAARELRKPAVRVADLNRVFTALPPLGDDAEAFARDVELIRDELPAESDAWI